MSPRILGSLCMYINHVLIYVISHLQQFKSLSQEERGGLLWGLIYILSFYLNINNRTE